MNDRMKGSLLVVASALVWGTVGISTRFAGDVSGVNIALYRCAFAAITVFIFILLTKRFPDMVPKGKIPVLLLLGISIALISVFFAMSIKVSTIATAVLLLYTAPVIATVFSRIFLKEKIKRVSFACLVVCIIGIIFISGNGFDGSMWLGIAFGLIAGISYASQMTIGRYLKEYSCLTITLWMNIIAMLIILPLASPFSVPVDKLPILIVMGVLHSAIAPLLFFQGVKYIKTQDAGIITMLDPLTNIILGALIFLEIPGIFTSIGGVLILVAVLLQIVVKKH